MDTIKKPRTLLIVESPAKAKTIEKYLGSSYRVLSSVGHVRDIPKTNKDAVDIAGGFIPRYIISPGKEQIISSLQTAAKKVDTVLLASDPDREGEAIAWHVAELIKDYNQNFKRIVFHEITAQAIKEAITRPREIDLNLKLAQEARRVLDRLVGYDLSGLIWKKVRYGLSAGRVQSPALRIIMEREREIRAFIPADFFVITAPTVIEKLPIEFVCSLTPAKETEALRIKSLGDTHSWYVKDTKETKTKRTPKPPFITSTLQQVASTRLGFAPSRTMGAAQKLYESGHITYMRTDSTVLSTGSQKQIIDYITSAYGQEYLSPRQYQTTSKSAQEAHEPVRPTNISQLSAGLTADQKALYQLIWKRTVASQMSDADVIRTKVTINIKDSPDPIPDFIVNGSQLLFAGWLKVDTIARGEDTILPTITKDTNLSIDKLKLEAKQTQPPSRYTEAGLIKELEKRGIGRPSTYASIMNTILQRGYVTKEGRTLFPTDTGDVVSTFLEKHFKKYISDTFTSELEDELDDIASGTRDYTKTLKDFYEPFQTAVKSKENTPKLTNLGAGPTQFPCPVCGSKMVIKLGKAGTFLSCEKFPDCNGARLLDGGELKPEAPIGQHPDTGEDIYLMNGKFGPYVQLGITPEKIKGKKAVKPKRASLPSGVKVEDVTLTEAIKYLQLPRELGHHPNTNEPVIANTGQYGPYIAHAGDFRSLKSGDDDPYTITYERALEILKEPKQGRKGETLIKELGLNPKTKKLVNVYESKSGRYLRKGWKRINIPDDIKTDNITLEMAIELLKQ